MTCKICGGPTVGDYPGADIYHMSCLMQTTQHLRRRKMDKCQHCGTPLDLDNLEENHHGCVDHDHGKDTLCPHCRWCAACDRVEHQCEVCDEFFIDHKPITSEDTGKRGFCSDDCLFEALEDLRIACIEARQQYELYGDDLDSWFR